MKNEAIDSSKNHKYYSTNLNGQPQPFQDVIKQYNDYIKDGYDELFFKNMNSYSCHFGVWITCFVAFLNKDNDIKEFLDLWFLQNLKYTTQDQVSFSYVCQKTKLIPYTLPNKEIFGDKPHSNTQFYIKHEHNN